MNRLRRTGTRLSLAGFGSLLLACSSTTTVIDGTTLTTGVVVVPEDFLGTLPCTTDAGAMQTYRATLVDVTKGLNDDSPEIQSDLISCKRAAYFEGVTVGNRYIARVAGYERGDLMVDAESGATLDPGGNPIASTWTTTCYGNEIPDSAGMGGESAGGAGGQGNDELGVEAYTQARVYARACVPLTRTSEPGETGAIIGIESALGALECGEAPDEVDHFIVLGGDGTEEGSGAAGANGGLGGAGGDAGGDGEAELSASCTETVTIVDLEDGENYTFDVVAFEADADEPRWGTTCRMTARDGVLVRANCETLRPLG